MRARTLPESSATPAAAAWAGIVSGCQLMHALIADALGGLPASLRTAPAPPDPRLDEVLQTVADLRARRDRAPSDDEIGRALGVSYTKACRLVDLLRDRGLVYRQHGVRLTDAGHAQLGRLPVAAPAAAGEAA